MIELLIGAIWFMLPAMVSNMMPVFAAKYKWLPSLNKPLDNGHKIAKKRLFGDNKTYRGLLVGVLFAVVVGYVQYLVNSESSFFNELQFIEGLGLVGQLGLAAALGFGALLGDAFESSIKRQLDIEPGSSWFPYDQLDYIFGALILAAPFGLLNFFEYLAIIAVGFLLHVASTVIGFKLGLKKKPI